MFVTFDRSATTILQTPAAVDARVLVKYLDMSRFESVLGRTAPLCVCHAAVETAGKQDR